MTNGVERGQVSAVENDRLGKEESMVFDLCFGWVPIEDLLMGDEEFTADTAREETPRLGD